MDFEWDPAKAATNRGKHALHLADAPPVFEDPYALTRPDTHPTEDAVRHAGPERARPRDRRGLVLER